MAAVTTRVLKNGAASGGISGGSCPRLAGVAIGRGAAGVRTTLAHLPLTIHTNGHKWTPMKHYLHTPGEA